MLTITARIVVAIDFKLLLINVNLALQFTQGIEKHAFD